MTDEHPPNPEITKALSGAIDEADRLVPCCACKRMTVCPGFIIASVKLWNRDEVKLAEKHERKAQLIAYGELLPCELCAVAERERRRAEYILENSTTEIWLRELKQGRYNPESLAWLRRHGHAADVLRILNEEGKKS